MVKNHIMSGGKSTTKWSIFMFKRNLEEKLSEMIEFSPVVLLTGARQTGKTTIMNFLKNNDSYSFVSFDDLKMLSTAKNDPIGFISNMKLPLIIDEVQKVPELLQVIKYQVDKNRKPSMYILTGSTNVLMLPKISESLAGRMILLDLWPLSQGEIVGKKEKFIDTMFEEKFELKSFPSISRENYITKLIKGGFPSLQNEDQPIRREEWCNSYLTTILRKDIQDLANIEKVESLPNLMQFLAIRCSNLLNISELSRTTKLSTTTLKRYLILLKTLYMVHFQLPWHNNLNKRLMKSSKVYLVDTALICYLLGVDEKRLENDNHLFGHILENFVVMELLKQSSWAKKRVKFFHYRTLKGEEIDIIAENGMGEIVAIEIKSSETVKAEDFAAMKNLQTAYKKKFLKGIVLYLGNEAIPFGKDLYALPINSLWES